MEFESWFSSVHPSIPTESAGAVLRLVADGATVPFIARYRKEQTRNLDEVAIQSVIDAKERWDEILNRQEYILGEIEKQQKLTPELRDQIRSAFTMERLEDLYLPYKVKRKSKAAKAKEAGLEPLADWIWNCGHGTETPQPGQTLELWALTFRNDKAGISDAESAVQGAQDILVERLAEIQELRELARSALFERGFIRTEKADKAQPNSKFDKYFTFQEEISSLLEPEHSHRYLAVRRGWMEEELKLIVGGAADDAGFEDELIRGFEAAAITVSDSPGAAVLTKAARLAYKAHVFPSIESEVHKALKHVADEVAAKVFAENVRKLLMASPFGPKAVLGVDPGVRTGCKLAVIDGSGKFLGSELMHLRTDSDKEKAKTLLREVMKNVQLQAIAVGNGTAGRETELFLRAAVKELGSEVPVVMVNEAGASVYSASEAAREEFPDLDVTVRGAISIARRLQDPLAELVKIDPKSIGVGQYQHDISPHLLKKSLDLVVDSCVNQVGVNLNTASIHLLSHVSGIGPGLAKAVVEHRGAKGLFRSRQELLEVPRFSKKCFEQAAGFLRVAGGENPLDNTGVHPEQYGVLEKLAANLSKKVEELLGAGVELVRKSKELRDEVGEFTFADIIRELEKPGRDPREQFVPFSFREDIHELKDLKPDLVCPGIVTNVTNFGAFVDIGVHQDGLVHISQLSDRFIKEPQEVVSPGDHVQVKVLEVNLEKKQIALTMKGLGSKAAKGREAEGRSRHGAKGEQRRGGGNARPPRPPREKPVERVALVPSAGPPPVQPRKPGPPPSVKPKQVFKNNPFAGLAGMLKPGSKSDNKS